MKYLSMKIYILTSLIFITFNSLKISKRKSKSKNIEFKMCSFCAFNRVIPAECLINDLNNADGIIFKFSKENKQHILSNFPVQPEDSKSNVIAYFEDFSDNNLLALRSYFSGIVGDNPELLKLKFNAIKSIKVDKKGGNTTYKFQLSNDQVFFLAFTDLFNNIPFISLKIYTLRFILKFEKAEYYIPFNYNKITESLDFLVEASLLDIKELADFLNCQKIENFIYINCSKAISSFDSYFIKTLSNKTIIHLSSGILKKDDLDLEIQNTDKDKIHLPELRFSLNKLKIKEDSK